MPALPQPEETVNAADRVFREAEAMDAQELGVAKPYTHRRFLSNGTGLGSWSQAGHAISWRIAVPKAGRYALVLKAAVWEEEGARRLVQLDGVDLNDGLPSLFAHTGGFGADPSQWRHYAVAGRDGAPLALELSAGLHALTLTSFGGGMNLDTLVLVPLGR